VKSAYQCGHVLFLFIGLKYCRKTKCSECAELADGPVKLPCRHVLCLKCIVQLKELELFFCPECQKKFPADLKVEVISEKKYVVFTCMLQYLCVC